MVFRLEPKLSPQFMQTYQILRPRTVQTRIASCEAAGCAHYEQGWKTIVPKGSPQEAYIRNDSGRRFWETIENGYDGLCTFNFYPGQQCFQTHHVQDRPALFIRRKGDWRGYQSQPYVHSSPDNWVDDFATHQADLADQLEKG